MNFLQGKKTYIIAIALVLYAVGGFVTGNLTGDQVVELLGLGGLGAALRLGMQSK